MFFFLIIIIIIPSLRFCHHSCVLPWTVIFFLHTHTNTFSYCDAGVEKAFHERGTCIAVTLSYRQVETEAMERKCPLELFGRATVYSYLYYTLSLLPRVCTNTVLSRESLFFLLLFRNKATWQPPGDAELKHQ